MPEHTETRKKKASETRHAGTIVHIQDKAIVYNADAPCLWCACGSLLVCALTPPAHNLGCSDS